MARRLLGDVPPGRPLIATGVSANPRDVGSSASGSLSGTQRGQSCLVRRARTAPPSTALRSLAFCDMSPWASRDQIAESVAVRHEAKVALALDCESDLVEWCS